MAKKSSIEKNNRRKKMSKNAAPKRARLKAIIADKNLPMEERFAATLKLAEMPRNSSATRIRNRCDLTGRPQYLTDHHAPLEAGPANHHAPAARPMVAAGAGVPVAKSLALLSLSVQPEAARSSALVLDGAVATAPMLKTVDFDTRKALAAGRTADDYETWGVPYLPIDPKDRKRVDAALFHPRRITHSTLVAQDFAGVDRFLTEVAGLNAVARGDGIARCRMIFDPGYTLVRPTPRRAFQGWRYLEEKDAPPDLKGAAAAGIGDMPEQMRAELAALGLI